MATPDSKPNPEQIKIVTWNPKGPLAALEDKLSELLCCRIPKAFLCGQEVRKNSVLNKNRRKSHQKETCQPVYLPESEPVDEDSKIPPEVCDLSNLRCSGIRVTHKSFILVSFHGEHKQTKQTKGDISHLSDGEKNDKQESFNHTQEDPDNLSDSVYVKNDKQESFNHTQEDPDSLSDSVCVKNNKLELFINEMIKLANHYNLLVIVGGDFNYKVKKWKTKIEKEYRGQVVVAPLYAGVPNRRHAKNVIDTFIVVYPDDCKNVVTCKFHTPIPIYMLPTKDYVGDIDDETKIIDYPNSARPCCKVFNYSRKELQELKTTIINASKEKPDFEESYKDNKTDAILPLWPKCKFLDELNHDPVMVTIELIPPEVSV